MRPVIDGVTWMEDDGIFLSLSVGRGVFHGDCFSSPRPLAVISVEEAVGVADAAAVQPPLRIDEGIAVTDDTVVRPPLQVDESIRVDDGVTVPQPLRGDEPIGVGEDAAVRPPLRVDEAITVGDDLVPSSVLPVTEQVIASDDVTVAPPRSGSGASVSVSDEVFIVIFNPAPRSGGPSTGTPDRRVALHLDDILGVDRISR